MFFRKIALLLLVTSAVLGFTIPLSISAQESETVTATVTVNNLNIRYAPSQWNVYGFDNRVGQLQQGDAVIVQKMETVEGWTSRDWPWVYVVHPASGLEGWAASDYLAFSREDWQAILPKIESSDELSYLEGAAQYPFKAQIDGGAYDFTRIRAEPYYGAPILGYLSHEEQIEILGSAVVNGEIHYVYARQLPENGTLEGWVWQNSISVTIWSPNRNWRYALPVMLERDLHTEFASLPQAQLNENIRYVRLRSEPTFAGNPISNIHKNEVVAVQGRSGEWLYILIIDSGFDGGLSGWVYAPNFTYLNGVTFESLPIITP